MSLRPSAKRTLRRRLLIAAVGCCCTLAAAPAPLANLPRLFCCFQANPARPEETASRYDVIIWHNHPTLQQALVNLKQRSPHLTGLMYRELFCILQEETPMEESVGHAAWIERHHPDWFQRDLQGRRVEVPDYPGRWMMNLGHPDWQAFWIEQTLADVADGGWDGVFVDDALTNVHAHQLPPLAGYADDAALQEAVTQFLSRITAAFHAAGKVVIANASNTSDYPGLWERWLQVTDGLMEEHFAGTGWTWGPDVATRQLAAMRSAERLGKWMRCFTYGDWDDVKRMESSLAAYLVGAGPRVYWSYRPARESEPTVAPAAQSVQVGRPLGPATVDGSLWQRRFEQAVALVNVGAQPRRTQTPCGLVELDPYQGRILHTDCRPFS